MISKYKHFIKFNNNHHATKRIDMHIDIHCKRCDQFIEPNIYKESYFRDSFFCLPCKKLILQLENEKKQKELLKI